MNGELSPSKPDGREALSLGADDDRTRRRRVLRRVFVTTWLVYAAHFAPEATGSGRFVALAIALARGQTIALDGYRTLPGVESELSFSSGHVFLNTNPGMAILAAPAV